MNISLERLRLAIEIQKDDGDLWFSDPTHREKILQHALRLMHDMINAELIMSNVDKFIGNGYRTCVPSNEKIVEEAVRDKTHHPCYSKGFIEGCGWMMREINKKSNKI